LILKAEDLGVALASKAALLLLILEGLLDEGEVENDLLLAGLALGELDGVEERGNLDVLLNELERSLDVLDGVRLNKEMNRLVSERQNQESSNQVSGVVVNDLGIPAVDEGEERLTINEAIKHRI